MVRARTPVLVAASLVLGCGAWTNAHARGQRHRLADIKSGGISFAYDRAVFSAVDVVKIKKSTVFGKYGPADGKGEAPRHVCFKLVYRNPAPAIENGSRYYFPSDTYICAFPLRDASVKDFGKAYTPLFTDARHLRMLLREHPGDLARWSKASGLDIPDFPELDAGNSIISKFRYLDFRSGSGIVFLTQYSNELEPNPANNEQLTLDFQGLTKDGRYYVAARLAITHPALPAGIQSTGGIQRDMRGDYLRREDKKLDSLPEDSFRPSMKILKAMLSSLHLESSAGASQSTAKGG